MPCGDIILRYLARAFFTEASDGKEDEAVDADEVAPNVAAAAAEPTVAPIKREAVKRMQVRLCARVCVGGVFIFVYYV